MYIKLLFLIRFIVFMGIMTYLSYLYGIYFMIIHFEKNVWHTTFTIFSVVGTIFFTVLFLMSFLMPV